MANSTPVVITVTGTTTASDVDEDFAIAGGTQTDKMWHVYHGRHVYGAATLDDAMRSTEITAANNLKFRGFNPIAETFHAFVLAFLAGDDIVVQRPAFTAPAVGATHDITITALSAINRSFALPHGMEDNVSAALDGETQLTLHFTSTTNLRVTCADLFSKYALITGRIEVIDWGNSAITVQQVSATGVVAASSAVVITAVELSRTWIIGSWTGGGGNPNQRREWGANIDFQDTTHARFTISTYSGSSYEWRAFVIEDTADLVWTVQHVAAAMVAAAASATAAIAAVTLARAMIVNAAQAFGIASGSGKSTSTTIVANGGSLLCDASFNSTTQVQAARTTTTGNCDVLLQVIEFANAQSNAPRALDHYCRRRAA